MSADRRTATVRPIKMSNLTAEALRSLRVWEMGKARHDALVESGLMPRGEFKDLSVHVRELFLAEAEGQLASPPVIPPRDEVVGRDQVTREERGRLLQFGGPHV